MNREASERSDTPNQTPALVAGQEASPALDQQSRYGSLLGTPPAVALVVEDDEDARDLLLLALRRHGLEVIGVGDVESALAVLAAREVGLVVLDVSLPDGDGFEVCQAVRDHPRTRDVPVVMLTARDSLESELEGVLRGADAYLVKPVSTTELLRRVSDLV